MSDAGARRIIVGVDGSPNSRAALRWAVHEARLRDAELHAVHAWTVPSGFGGVPARPPVPQAEGSFHEEATNLLNGAVDQALGDQAGTIEVHRHLIQRRPADALIELSEGAELLVVGARGHGRLLGMLLGSVSHASVNGATCPVVVVPDPESKEARKEARSGATRLAPDPQPS